MKVKISYNIELDDVPSHVSDLLDNISKRLTALSQGTTNTATKVRTNQFPASVLVNTLGNLREELEKIDTMMGDFGAILAGYEQAKLNPESAPRYSSTEEELETQMEPELE